jgi:hypothetical protein
MSGLIPEQQITDKRLERFQGVIRDICRSSKAFKHKVDVQLSHIAWRAAQTGSDVRNAMNHERIASVILSGKLNQKHCRVANPVELAFEGRFIDLCLVTFNPVQEIKMENVGIRVIVREGSSKQFCFLMRFAS